MGPGAIGYPDLAAWQHLNRVELSPWEIDALIDMDRAARAALQETKP